MDEAPPDHSTISRTRRLIDVETHRAVFTWVQQRLVEAGLLKGKTVAIDATTLEANAAMRSIVRRDTAETLSGVSDAAREGLGHRDADARGLGAAGSEAQEEDVEQGLDEPARSGCEGHEDERRPDASGPQSRACGRSGDRRDCRGDAAGRRPRRHDDDRRDGDGRGRAGRRRAGRRRRSRRRWKRSSRTRAITAIRRWSTSTPCGIRSYIAEPDRGRRDWSEGARGPGAGVWQSSPDSRTTRTAADAPTRRDDRTLVRASL